MGVIDLRCEFADRAHDAEAIRQKGFRELDMDRAIEQLFQRLERKGYPAAEIIDRLQGWGTALAELARADCESA